MTYQECRNIFTGEIDPDAIYLIDDAGTFTWIPKDSRLWVDYQQWLSEGNKPLAA